MRCSPLVRATGIARATVKLPKCAAPGCGVRFVKERAKQVVCGIDCGEKLAVSDRAKQERKQAKAGKAADRAQREALKPLRHWAALAQKAVNRYVRARDFGKGCISCQLPATWDGQWHASHLRSTAAAPAIRFNLWNIHKSCSVCNNYKSGNLAEYMPRAVALIGSERVAWLYAQNSPAKYTREHLQRLASVFNRKAERQEKRNES